MSAETSTEALLAAHRSLSARVRNAQKNRRILLEELGYDIGFSPIPSPSGSRSPSPSSDLPPAVLQATINATRPDLPPAKRARAARYMNYVPEEETIRNDYSQHCVDSGEWPQNWVLGADPENRFEEYPKQQRLLALKRAAVEDSAHPPAFLPLSALKTLHPCKFDVVLIDPPFSSSFTWDTLAELPVPSLSADPSFVFLWVGSGAGDGLERGREILAKWGFRRCEDVVWVKTNKTSNRGPGTDIPTTSSLVRTKQHCLMGIRGTVRRSTDSWFVHCNIDTDVIIWEGDPEDPTRKPPEMYTLIENFCLGLRRLELFGRPTTLRRGWVTVADCEPSEDFLRAMGARRWDKEQWEADVKRGIGGKPLVSNTAEIELLRPKSPVRGGSGNNPGQQHSNAPASIPNVGNPVMNNPNVGVAMPYPVQSMIPPVMPMAPMGMGMPMGMNPAMAMMPMPMNPMAMGMPMWMGMPGMGDQMGFGGPPMMNNDIWMGDGLWDADMGGQG